MNPCLKKAQKGQNILDVRDLLVGVNRSFVILMRERNGKERGERRKGK